MPPARYANTPIILISNTYHHIGGRAGLSGQIELYPNEIGQFLVWNAPEDIQQEIRSKVETSHQKREPICWSICVDPQIPNLQSHLQRLFYPSISY